MAAQLIRYGLLWNEGTTDLEIERQMIRRGGQWIGKSRQTIGLGLFEHYKRFESLLWPDDKLWHRWNELQLQEWLKHRTIGVIGPASSGKTNAAATDNLADYYCFPDETSILICSTTRERLQDRIWGEIKKYHKLAKDRHPELPGHLIDSRMRLVTDSKTEAADGRDFRNGIIGVAAKTGGSYVGLGEFIGIKNKRVRMVADELQLLPPAFVFSVSNLDKNPDLKVIGLGNPKETTDALGAFCEPSEELGGWEGGVDQEPVTKTWPTTRQDGVCVQFVGTDSPNLDGKLGIPLITQEAMDRDISQYGRDSLQFTMMNQGMMPRGQGSRRVITRQLCQQKGALEQPLWNSSERIKIGCLDAAYGGVGGDRCIFGEIHVGYEAATLPQSSGDEWNVVNQNGVADRHRQIVAVADLIMVPLNAKLDVEPEEQIVNWVREQCDKRGIPPANFFYDSGMRTKLVTMFGRLWTPQVNSIDCGGSASDRQVSNLTVQERGKQPRPKLAREHYANFITELWFSVRLAIEAGQFRGLKESAMQEGCQREWKSVGKNRIQVETKKEMKEKIGKSPDLFDCLAIGIEGARRRGFNITGLVAKLDKDEPNEAWKRKVAEKARRQWSDGELNYAA